ncbi:MAG: histidinol-phosphate transaminase [Chloroflexi bacterium]|nr:histidinol-phosphate transaminase [Chloroflexota bacterium]MCY4248621.1 histidinol-phosphate transaminase [Chloroflexota bacterium]
MSSHLRIRRDIAAMSAYTPTTSLEVFAQRLGLSADRLIKLDANENPFGPSPRVHEALAQLAGAHIYPDPESGRLRALLADYCGAPAEQILCGAGADELIELILQLFIEPGDCIINTPPTFAMYSFDAPLYHARVIDVPRRADFSLDVEAIEQAVQRHSPKLVFLCSPNNPSGNIIPSAQFERLLALPTMLALDEAYIEFAEADSLASQVGARKNLIVLRTLSKWAGLAGLRLGYGIFPPALMPHLWKIKQPYNVNVAADVAGQASLEDSDLLHDRIAELKRQRQRLESALAQLPFLHPYPSQANFVLCRVVGLPASQLRDRLAQAGIIVRYYDKPRLRDHIRISAGTAPQIDRLLTALIRIADQSAPPSPGPLSPPRGKRS